MKKHAFNLAAACLLLTSTAAHADILYTFSATELSGSATKDFSFTLRYDNYVHTLGLNAVTPIASDVKSSLGYDVAYAGTWSVDSVWGFDDSNHGATSGNGWFGFDYDSLVFVTDVYVKNITAPGTYEGTFSGNVGTVFFGTGTLTVTDTAAVPEPSALALLGLGATGLCWTRRRRAARSKA